MRNAHDEPKRRRTRISKQQLEILGFLAAIQAGGMRRVELRRQLFRQREYRRPSGRWRPDPLTPAQRASFARSLALLEVNGLIKCKGGSSWDAITITDSGRQEYESRKPIVKPKAVTTFIWGSTVVKS